VPGETACNRRFVTNTFNESGEYLVSEVIEFLERLGCDARLRHASNDEVEQALAQAGIADPVRATILWGDRPALESLLGAKANVFCGVVVPAEPDEQEPDEQDDDEEEDGEDDKEDE
jgi:hypothetical protein